VVVCNDPWFQLVNAKLLFRKDARTITQPKSLNVRFAAQLSIVKLDFKHGNMVEIAQGEDIIDHSGISVSNFERSKVFYELALAPLGASLLHLVPLEQTGGVKVGGFGKETPCFWLDEGEAHKPPLHFAFKAESRRIVDAFYAAAIRAGGLDNGKPGLRKHYHENYYGAFVLDPDGNDIEAVCHKPE
jgi:catechol 2,3-dioxygenase-like lactoylglutathione lyase family enzyme